MIEAEEKEGGRKCFQMMAEYSSKEKQSQTTNASGKTCTEGSSQRQASSVLITSEETQTGAVYISCGGDDGETNGCNEGDNGTNPQRLLSSSTRPAEPKINTSVVPERPPLHTGDSAPTKPPVSVGGGPHIHQALDLHRASNMNKSSSSPHLLVVKAAL